MHILLMQHSSLMFLMHHRPDRVGYFRKFNTVFATRLYASGHDNPGTPYFSFFLNLWQIFSSSPAAYCRRGISGPRFPFFLQQVHPSSSYWYWCSLKSKVYPRLLLCTNNIATGGYIWGRIFDFGEYHTRIMLCKYDSSNIVCKADSDKKK